MGSRAAALGMNGVVLDVEREWATDDYDSATRLLSAVRSAFPGRPVYASSYSTVTLHPEFPWAAFAGVDGWIPQVYWAASKNWNVKVIDEGG